MAVLTYVPYVGYISFGMVSMTTIHLLVLVFTYLAGWKHGWAFGLIFGLFSLLKAVTAPVSALDPYFVNPLVSVLPRIVFGIVAGILFDLAKKYCKSLSLLVPGIIAISVFSTFVHSVLVLGLLGILNFDILDSEVLVESGGYWAAFGFTMLANTIPEMVLAGIVVCPVALGLKYPYHYVFGGRKMKPSISVKKEFYKETSYRKLVKPYIEDAKKELLNYLRINSIYDQSTVSDELPYGTGVESALAYIADLGEKMGFKVERCHHRCTELSYGEGPLLDIYAHADVVPVSSTWKTNPFEPTIEGDILYARGASDDKGPGMSALFAAKALLDAGKLEGFKLRLIFGGDEERGSSCLEYYFHDLKKEYPTYGFTPDSDFPMIYAEKSIHTVKLTYVLPELSKVMKDFAWGTATNVVIGHIQAELHGDESEISQLITDYRTEYPNVGLAYQNGELEVKGKSVHGATPWEGINAGLHFLNFVGKLHRIPELGQIFKALENGDGREIGGDFTSETFDSTSYAVGIIQLSGDELTVLVNLRIPENITAAEPIAKLISYTKGKAEDLGGADALLIPLDSPLVQTLLKVYQDETGDCESAPLAIGGGTYAKESKNSLAFGPTFPGRDFRIHQDGEFIYISDYENYIGIYAHAIDALGQLLKESK